MGKKNDFEKFKDAFSDKAEIRTIIFQDISRQYAGQRVLYVDRNMQRDNLHLIKLMKSFVWQNVDSFLGQQGRYNLLKVFRMPHTMYLLIPILWKQDCVKNCRNIVPFVNHDGFYYENNRVDHENFLQLQWRDYKLLHAYFHFLQYTDTTYDDRVDDIVVGFVIEFKGQFSKRVKNIYPEEVLKNINL